MYKEFFGLKAKPFELLPNPEFLYHSKGHQKALSYLRYGIQDQAGFTLMTGEVGSGKTTLVRDIVRQVNASTPLAMIFNTRIDAVQLLAMINEDFGLEVRGKDKVLLLRELNDFLVAQSGQGCLPILIIDEAQNLSPNALEEVRLLSNLEADCFKLLQIILVGQPELKNVIAQPSLRQLRQRISIACHLGPLSREETEDYVFHRLATAGNREAVAFEQKAFDSIFNFSGGVPRLINVICDFLLLSAFVEETKQISEELVQEAAGELTLKATPDIHVETDRIPFQGGSFLQSYLEAYLTRIEKKYACLSALQTERETIEDRLSSHGRLLEYLINKQQSQFREVGEDLKEITDQVDRLWQIMMPESEGDVINIEERRKI